MKLNAYIHAAWADWKKEYVFHVWGQDMSSQEHCGALVETVEIDFNPPPNDVLVNGAIAAYRKQQQTIRAEAERACNELQGRINDLLCLENKSEQAVTHD